MTIAMCYVSPEGVVLGADSTASASFDDGLFHYFNHNQKLLQIGEDSTLALLTWGLGGLPSTSYRTLVAVLADDFKKKRPASVQQAAERWSALIWKHYSAEFAAELARIQDLQGKPPFAATGAPPIPDARTEKEETELKSLIGNLYVGFCIAGYCTPDRSPKAFEVSLMPTVLAVPVPTRLGMNAFWGAPNLILRLMNGYDGDLKVGLLGSGKWTGTEAELDAVLAQNALRMPTLPIRDAVDFVYSCIHSTIKALKFSSLNQICGGPIELAVITTDRPFRWVRHKSWDAAITEGDIS